MKKNSLKFLLGTVITSRQYDQVGGEGTIGAERGNGRSERVQEDATGTWKRSPMRQKSPSRKPRRLRTEMTLVGPRVTVGGARP